LTADYADEVTPCALPVVTVTNAPSDLSPGDLIAMWSKIGVIPFTELTKQPFKETVQLPPLKNKVLNLTATCPSASSPVKFTQTAKITYQNPPRLALSGGILLAPGVNSFGIKTTKTGIGTGGVVTTQNSITESGGSSVQVIPFAFSNIYYAGS